MDSRESAPALLDALRSRHGLCVEVARLGAGDYLIDGLILVERKRWNDFEQGIVTGRLFKQAHKLACGSWLPFMVIEGREEEGGGGRLAANAARGAEIALSLKFGIPVLRTSNQEESAFVLSDLLLQNRKAGSASVRKGYAPKRVRNRALYVVTGLPGVGRKIGTDALERFGSLRAAFGASEDAWLGVPGVGKTRARRIADLLDMRL